MISIVSPINVLRNHLGRLIMKNHDEITELLTDSFSCDVSRLFPALHALFFLITPLSTYQQVDVSTYRGDGEFLSPPSMCRRIVSLLSLWSTCLLIDNRLFSTYRRWLAGPFISLMIDTEMTLVVDSSPSFFSAID